MLEIFQKFVALLLADSTVTGLLTTTKADGKPSVNIFTGPVDIAMEKQKDLLYPQVVLSQVSEVSRTVPQGARDTHVQLDIWSRNSQMEVEQIYEAVLNALNYQSGDQGTAHIFWERLGGAIDSFETDRRVWHRSCDYMVWAIKP